MLIFLLIYVPGIIATLWFLYHMLRSGEKVTLAGLLLGILVSSWSWFTFIIIIMVAYGDKTVFEKK